MPTFCPYDLNSIRQCSVRSIMCHRPLSVMLLTKCSHNCSLNAQPSLFYAEICKIFCLRLWNQVWKQSVPSHFIFNYNEIILTVKANAEKKLFVIKSFFFLHTHTHENREIQIKDKFEREICNEDNKERMHLSLNDGSSSSVLNMPGTWWTRWWGAHR